MRIIYLLSFLFLCQGVKAQQVMEVYPEDDCADHVSYGAFLPADINKNQDEQTKKNLAKYRLEFTVEKEKYIAGETVQVVLYNKGSEPVELAVATIKKEAKKGCESKGKDYAVWTGKQAEISLIHVVFYGEQRWIDPGEKIEFRIHLKEIGKYKLGLLTGNETFGDAGLIVTPAFDVVNP